MTFTYYHPTHYKKLKQNSGRSSKVLSKDKVSEDLNQILPPTMETKVGKVGSHYHSTHTSAKKEKHD